MHPPQTSVTIQKNQKVVQNVLDLLSINQKKILTSFKKYQTRRGKIKNAHIKYYEQSKKTMILDKKNATYYKQNQVCLICR